MKTRPAFGFVISNALLLWGSIAIASIALWPIYRNTSMIVMVVTATLLGSAIAILGAYFRWSPPILLVATELLGTDALLRELRLRFSSTATAAGYIRTEAGLRSLWRRSHRSRPLAVGGLAGFLLTRR